MTKDLQELEKIAKHLHTDKTLTFDMKRINKHWLVDYEYFFVSSNYTVENLYADSILGYFYRTRNIDPRHVSPHDFIQVEMEKSIKDYWSDKLDIGRVEILAWSKYTVEKDTGLCYIFDSDDKNLGIFCHCMDRVEEFIYVGKSIDDFFDLTAAAQLISKHNPQEDFPMPKRKLSKEQSLTYKKLLKKDEFKILDAELGFSITFELYKNLLDETFIPLSKNDLKYTRLEFVDNKECLHFKWHVNSTVFEVKLENQSDYIDMAIYKFMNEVLQFLGSEKRFVLFREFGFGQEYGVAYVDDKTQNKLKNLMQVELINF